MTKAELIAMVEKLPDDTQIFIAEMPYDVVSIRIFKTQRDPKWIEWYFGP